MHNWFECKVSFEKMLENGMQKKVTEPYLVDDEKSGAEKKTAAQMLAQAAT